MKISILLLLFIAEIYSQGDIDPLQQNSNPFPCIPVIAPGSNSIDYDPSTNTYHFYYNNLKLYEYTTNFGGSLMGLKVCTKNSSFNPSDWGGIWAILEKNEVPSWSNTQYECLTNNPDISTDNKSVHISWKMKYLHDSLSFSYRFSIMGRTLIIQVECDSAVVNKAFRLDLSRCSHAVNAFQIGIPYLTLFNVLFANNVFTSFFIDWELTNSSELRPQSHDWDSTSVHYAMEALYNLKTDNTRNRLKETLYLTSSPNLEDVFPSIPNPVSIYKHESANRIIWDYREPFGRLVSPGFENLTKMHNSGIQNIWLIIHDWQRRHTYNSNAYKGGNDDGLPNTFPANDTWETGAEYGGNKMLDSVIHLSGLYKYRIGLHLNYYDYYENAENDIGNYGFHLGDVLKMPYDNSSKIHKRNYKNLFGKWSYILKPSKTLAYATFWSSLIQKYLPINSCYLDVIPSANPSDAVDYDSSVPNAGYFHQTLNYYRNLYPLLRNIHRGPVIGEGGSHFLYQGYVDDVEARINYARLKSNTPLKNYIPFDIPLLVNFDLLKLRSKAFVHGVGYYPYFFGDSGILKHSQSDVLTYIATELAYGHGGYLPDESMTWNLVEHALIEQKYVYSIQKYLPDTDVQSILYNDNGELKNVSDYIRSHPKTFNNILSSDFMSQVTIKYRNGIVICVNRHPTHNWKVALGVDGIMCWYNYNSSSGMDTGYLKGSHSFHLPPGNGWACYIPSILINK